MKLFFRSITAFVIALWVITASAGIYVDKVDHLFEMGMATQLVDAIRITPNYTNRKLDDRFRHPRPRILGFCDQRAQRPAAGRTHGRDHLARGRTQGVDRRPA